eukprot:gnl/Chilomastix_cuspidata/2109.p2 GENE.gnl/Chilomastix_cuspidata/2109~~gnl/Chilomastix_cuspidata/2109.p2  ORF type:complete len:172 (+),score=71.38 gnl/Chilomastix_cuspidata/2109:575-1090(+)
MQSPEEPETRAKTSPTHAEEGSVSDRDLDKETALEYEKLKTIIHLCYAELIAQSRLKYSMELERIEEFVKESKNQIEADYQTAVAEARNSAHVHLREERRFIEAEMREFCYTQQLPSLPPGRRRQQPSTRRAARSHNQSVNMHKGIRIARNEAKLDLSVIQKIAQQIYTNK